MYFQEKLEAEKQAFPKIVSWLEEDFNFTLVKDVRLEEAFQNDGIDLIDLAVISEAKHNKISPQM